MILKSTLRKELEVVLAQKEILWFQKSRRDWISIEDRNTTFFHRKTISRRRRCKVEAIKNNEGQWLYDKEDIKNHVVHYFTELFKFDGGDFINYPISSIFPTMDDNLMSEIAQSVDDGEVRSTIFGMHPLKAPGVDGLHALFYQSQWNTVGNSV